MICASRNWGQRHGMPDRIEALQDVIAPTSRLRLFLERHVLSSGPMPAPALEVDNLSMVRSLVVAGFGCALLPSGMVEREGQVRRLRPDMPLG